ncbi:YceI family protein [Christiangramia salexigens]|uniref:Lipid/polyisoprenoid-binding YceI-like domain-containing protein n=1 Tax=Christiangramia salexigens TaxID=1913577 RepID=A0A1L3J1Y5_9FLAO|nr:YceI family protein [Christiangramia salexigens]APG59129.1 hypothetical protein LPB144_01340 [Christiangramia salexigens]
MKNLFASLLFMICFQILSAQKSTQTETFLILPESELIIAGSTNVNKFDCKFNIDLISGYMTVEYAEESNCIRFSNLDLNLLTEGFDCGNKRMNSDFQHLLMSDKFPEIQIRISEIQLISDEYLKTFISVRLAGIEQNYDFPVLLGNNSFAGKFKLNIRDFGLEPPKKVLGLIEVDEIIEVRFKLMIERKY